MIDDILVAVFELFDSDATLMNLFALALGSGAITLIVMKILDARAAVARRVASGKETGDGSVVGPPAGKVDIYIESLARSAGQLDAAHTRVLRTKLIQAGFYDARDVPRFFLMRIGASLTLGVILTVIGNFIVDDGDWVMLSVFALIGVALGFVAPSFILDRRIETCKREHATGFPDFMDLMVVCAQAGLSMEAGINRIASEISVAYPSLARNLDLAAREIRSGKPFSKSMDSLAVRLAIPESAAFATLLQQSEELGTSLSQSLRTYSDDMRNKRMMKAEEKAYALPAKMVIPLTLFVFPVLLVVLMLPVAISVANSNM